MRGSWWGALCTLLCAPALLTAAPPIRIIGSLTESPPIVPHSRPSNPLVPCAALSDSEAAPCNLAGFPSTKAWMVNLSSDARGTVKFMTPDYRSRAVLAHPDGLMLNDAVWRGLGIDFVTMRNEYMFRSTGRRGSLEHFASQGAHPWVMSDFMVDTEFPFLVNLLDVSHVKVVDGVKIGILVLWTSYVDSSFASFPHHTIVPILAARLRRQGVEQIVALRTGRVPSQDDLELLTAHDIDVIVTDVIPVQAPPSVRNGTTILTAPYYASRNDLLVLDMVQGASAWQYTLRAISLHDRPTPFYSDPTYLAAEQWIQGEMDRSNANDIQSTELTAPMPATQSTAGRLCRVQECEAGVLTADAMREQGGAQLAVALGGAMQVGRSGWPVGPVYRSALWSMYPFANTVCRVNVSATLLVDILNNGISQLLSDGQKDPNQSSGRFPQISGFRFTMNTQLPVGSRVVSVDVMQPDGTFAPLEKRRVYSLALQDYVLQGNSGFGMIPGNHQGPSECFVMTMMEATQGYLMRRRTYAPYTDGRIANDFEGMTLPMRNESLADCNAEEKHDPEWQDCVPCGAGFWRPDLAGNVCIEKVSSGLDMSLLLGLVAGAVVVASVPVAVVLAAVRRAASRRMQRQAHRVRHAPCNPWESIATVFTDIKRSTDLWATHHHEMSAALQQHHRICRELIDAHSGYEVKTIGDAFMVAFACPVDAVAFMLQLQLSLLEAEWPNRLQAHPACRREGLFNGLRVRAGAHYGRVNIVETPSGGYDYDGMTSNLAARVSDSGDGGQIVVTEEVYRVVEPHLDLLPCVPDVRFLGSHLFRGVPGEVACYQVMPDVLSERVFGTLRNVHLPRRPSKELLDDNGPTSVTKVQLTRAMQALRLWATRRPQGIPFTQLHALLAAGADDDVQLHRAVSLAAFEVLAKRLDTGATSDPYRHGRIDVISPLSPDSKASSHSDTAQQASAFRWPIVSDVLRVLPPSFVISLEADLNAESGSSFTTGSLRTGADGSDMLM